MASPPHERDHNLVRRLLNLKFEYARSIELLPGETPLVQFFQPTHCSERRLGVIRSRIWSAGDLLVATSRRLLWITERYKGQYEPYGTVSYSVPLQLMVDVRYGWADGEGGLEIAARSGGLWHIPLKHGKQHEVREFEAALRGIL